MAKSLKVRKIGNSYGLILSKEMLDELGVREGDILFQDGRPPAPLSIPLAQDQFVIPPGEQPALERSFRFRVHRKPHFPTRPGDPESHRPPL